MKGDIDMRYGLDTHGVKRIIQEKINKNPDIYYFINNDYIEELINLIIEGIADSIEQNNEKVFEDLYREIRIRS